MKDGVDPLDFIRNNLRQSDATIDPQAMADAIAKSKDPNAPQIAPAPPAPVVTPTIKTDFTASEAIDVAMSTSPEVKKEEVKPTDVTTTPTVTADPAITEEPKVDDTDLLLSDQEVPAVAENFKKVRTKLKETNKTLKEVQAEKEALKQSLEEYQTGAVLPDIVHSQEARIQELEKYEKILNLKVSKEYQESFVKPLDEVQSRLKEIAIDYEIPDGVLSQALNTGKESELNRFLSEHFDQLGAQEVKALVMRARDIQFRANEAEKEPAKAIEVLQAQHQALDAERQAQRKGAISNTAKGAWVNSLNRIKSDGLAIELIANPNDSAHNDTYVKPLLTKAASEYGKIVRMLADNGLENLPKELAEALATAVLYGHATPVAITTRNAALKHAEDITNNTKRNTGYERPQIGSSNPAAPAYRGPAPSSTKEAAQSLIDKVMPATR